MRWLAVSDLHGKPNRYRALFKEIEKRNPPAALLGGDLFPRMGRISEFLEEFLFKPIENLRKIGIGTRILAILGNDDPKEYEHLLIDADNKGLMEYIPMKKVEVEGIPVVGYPYVSPTPFLLKDWELFDVDKTLRQGAIPAREGIHTVDENLDILEERTMKKDLHGLSAMTDPSATVYLFHSPPYGTSLDLLGSRQLEDPHIGSQAIRDFIERNQPLVTLHGHIHESYHLSGRFFQRIGKTISISSCGIEKELILISFDPKGEENPLREVIE